MTGVKQRRQGNVQMPKTAPSPAFWPLMPSGPRPLLRLAPVPWWQVLKTHVMEDMEDMELTANSAALFGTGATTGQSVCRFGLQHVTTINPVAEWQAAQGGIGIAAPLD